MKCLVKRTFILIFSTIITVGSFFPTYAGGSIADLQQKQKAIENQIKEYRKQSAALKAEKNNVQAQINVLDNELNALNLELEGQQLRKQELTMQISEQEQQINNLNSEIEKNNKVLEERLRTMYKQGTSGYIEVILNSENLMEAITRADMVQMIVESDIELLKKIDQQKKQIEEIQASLKDQRAELSAIINNLQLKQNEVELASSQKEGYMASIEQNLETIKKYEAAMTAQSAQIEKDILALQRTDVKYVGGAMAWPVPSSQRITSFFGPRDEPIAGAGTNHGAIDVGASSGASIVSANDGIVMFAGWHYSYGNYVIVDHGGGISTLYAHCSSVLVGKGQSVTRGQKIALVGSTGYSTGPHLHFEVRKNGVRVNPLPYVK